MPSEPSDVDPAVIAAKRAILADWLSGPGGIDVAAALSLRPALAVVLTTSPEGFAAAESLSARLSARNADRFVAVTEIEYRGWCMRSPDETFHLHVNLWSWIKAPVPEVRRGEFAAWPIPPGAVRWLHRHGRRGADGERRGADLWAWDGIRASPLATGVDERARRPG